MPRRADKIKITIRVFDGDKERCERLFPSLNYNAAMRNIIHSFLNKADEDYNRLKAKPGLQAPKLPVDFVKAGDTND